MKESEFDPDFIKNLLHTVSLDGLRVAASNLGLDVSSIPTEITPELREDETFLKAMHGMLMDVHVMEGRPSRLHDGKWPENAWHVHAAPVAHRACASTGALICPETQRRFPIQNGIPNMMCVQYTSCQGE